MDSDKVKYGCSNCNGIRNHQILYIKEERFEEEINDYVSISSYASYKVISCLGCENISFVKYNWHSEMSEFDPETGEEISTGEELIYPPYQPGLSYLPNINFVPYHIQVIYKETINCLQNNILILAAGGLRAIIEAICKDCKATGKNLVDKIDSLHTKLILTQNECRRLHSIRFMGNEALHEINKPKLGDLHVLLNIVNHLLDNLYIQDKIIESTTGLVILNYKDFEFRISDDLYRLKSNNIYTLDQLLMGKIKLIKSKEDLESFSKTFKENVSNNKIKFLELTKEGKFKYLGGASMF